MNRRIDAWQMTGRMQTRKRKFGRKHQYVAFVLVCAVVSAAFALITVPSHVTAQQSPSAPAATVAYALTGTLKAEVKSVVSERTAEGRRLIAVVRMYNHGNRIARIPEYELKIATEDGLEYALVPSGVNPMSVQPKGRAELSYMIDVDAFAEVKPDKLVWAEVNPYVYPQTEKQVLSVPIKNLVWDSDQGKIGIDSQVKDWGQPFAIPALSPNLVYTPVKLLNQASGRKPAALLVLLAENVGNARETVPDFDINGMSDRLTYYGSRIGSEGVVLAPGERKHVYYSIPTDASASLNSLIVLTPETFAVDGQTMLNYSVGRLQIKLDGMSGAASAELRPVLYTLGNAIRFDAAAQLLPSDIKASLVDLRLLEGEGYNAVVSRFMLQNRNKDSMQFPAFAAELRTADGYSYRGSVLGEPEQTLIPKLNYIVGYSFIFPKSEQGRKVTLTILDEQTASPFVLPTASVQTELQESGTGTTFVMYPFEVEVKRADLEIANSMAGTLSYTYKLLLDLDVRRLEEAIVGEGLTKVKVELLDRNGNVLGIALKSLIGEEALADGEQKIVFDGFDQYQSGLAARLYEYVETPYGPVERLLATLEL